LGNEKKALGREQARQMFSKDEIVRVALPEVAKGEREKLQA